MEPYKRIQDLDFDKRLTLDVIKSLNVEGAGDLPESQLTALYQLITGVGQAPWIPAGQQMNFRPDAFKIIMLWTDADFHNEGFPYPGNTFQEVASAIEGLNRRRRDLQGTSPPSINIISIKGADPNVNLTKLEDELEQLAVLTGSLAGVGGIDCDEDGIIDVAQGEPLICPSFNGVGIAATMVSLVEGTVEAAKPTAACKMVATTPNSGSCTASGVSVDNSSSNPDGEPLVEIKQSPPGPYPLGTTTVKLTVKNSLGFTDTCITTITVVDNDSDKDGVIDCKDLCPGTIVGPADTVDENGCVPLLCSFSLLGNYMGKGGRSSDELVGLKYPTKFELVDCLDSDGFNCKAVGGRCVSIRMESDIDSYIRHRDIWMHVDDNSVTPGSFCEDASYCMLRGFTWPYQTFTDPYTVSFRPVNIPNQHIHMGAAGVAQALIYYNDLSIKWGFDCGGQNPLTTTHKPTDVCY
jgi:PKD repeat protein